MALDIDFGTLAESGRRVVQLDFMERFSVGFNPMEDASEETVEMTNNFRVFTQAALSLFVPGQIIWNWHLDAICEHLQAVSNGEIQNLIINVPPRCLKSSIASVCWTAWEWIRNPRLRYIYTAYSMDLSQRDNLACKDLIKSRWYQERFGGVYRIRPDVDAKKLFSNTAGGRRLATSVTSGNTGEGGERIVVDDPHDVRKSESEQDREQVIRWWTNTMASRVNTATSTRVIIGQRVHHRDLTGHIIERMREGGEQYELLVMPMEYEPKLIVERASLLPPPRVEIKPVTEDDDTWDEDAPEEEEAWEDKFDPATMMMRPDKVERSQAVIPRETVIGFEDPREAPGALLSPGQWPRKTIEERKFSLGPYAYACTPYESPILMADLTMKPIGEVHEGDVVMGFGKTPGPSKRKLERAIVKRIFRYRKKVQRMFMASGREVRCTDDHKWYTGRTEVGRQEYAPAKVGSLLHRVCDTDFPELSGEDQRLGGWLGGFFDGEGSYVGRLVSFTQGNDRNAAICRKLEATLDHFGLSWSVQQRSDRDYINWYYLRGGLPTLQKFMHIAQPVKWRERMAESYLGTARFVIDEDRVVAIEEEGEEDVFALETTTGNYIVWGYASSNSQYQQAPSPVEGGQFKGHYWQRYEYVPMFHRGLRPSVISVDSSYGTEEGDFTGVSVWGMFANRLYVLDARQWREEAPILRRRLRDLYAKWKVPFLIEKKANGITLIQDLRRGGDDERLPSLPVIEFSPDGMTKEARAFSVVSYVAAGLVYLPEGAEWVDEWILQHEQFPKGANDDLVDTSSMSITWLAKRTANIMDIFDMPIQQEYGRRAALPPGQREGFYTR